MRITAFAPSCTPGGSDDRISRHDFPIAPNLLAALTALRRPIWLADITYVETDQGWLSATVGPYSRKDVGLHVPITCARPAVGSLADGHLGAAARCRPDPPI